MDESVTWVAEILRPRPSIAVLLEEAGIPAEAIESNRAFASRWAWRHGEQIVTTVWVDEIDIIEGVPTWKMSDPASRGLSAPRRQHAAERYELLRGRDGGLVRAMIQRKRPDPDKYSSGVADRRGVDPVPWQVAVEGDDIVLRRLMTTSSGAVARETTSTQWELALQAVLANDGPASADDVFRFIRARKSAYKRSNLHPDLSMLSVNSPFRTSYSSNHRVGFTNTGHRHDKLFKIGRGQGATYEPYDPAVHGVWEIVEDYDGTAANGFSVRRAVDVLVSSLKAASVEADAGGAFDPDNIVDARRRVLATIVRRHGQPAFRQALIGCYEGACAMTGCNVEPILEAAHIHPYMGLATNDVRNGLLLRTDIHTLFDLGLIAIESDKMIIRTSPQLAGSDYASLDGASLRPRRKGSPSLSVAALDWHRSQSSWWT